MKLLLLILSLWLPWAAFSEKNPSREKFTIIKEVAHTPVIGQGQTGTCWSFATTSFLESEIMRKGFPEIKLSEMFFVNYNYKNKAFQYLLYQGHNNFGEGSLSHDVINVMRKYGIMTYNAFPGKKKDGKYNHAGLIKALTEKVNQINKEKTGSIDVSDLDSFDTILEKELGKLPKTMKLKGRKLTPDELRDAYKLNPDDYVELTSFSHHKYYKQCVIEIPDNWAHALYYNLPVDGLIEVMHYALNNGYSIAWDGDISEKNFSVQTGKADLPEQQRGKTNQIMRQKTFFNRTTTDDHLMHIIGLSKDNRGKNCFYAKDSWQPDNNVLGGYIHMTEDYVRMKTIGIMVHKNAIPKTIKEKLGL